MKLEETENIFDQLQKLHISLGTFFKESGKNELNERIQLLLNYLGAHEENFKLAIQSYREFVPKSVKVALLRNETCGHIIEKLKELKESGKWNVDDILLQSLELDDCLIKFYQQLSQKTEIKSIREIFTNMADRICMEKKIMVRDVGLLHDL